MLASLKNLGPRSAAMLDKAGIEDVDTLHALGAVRAYAQVKQAGLKPSLNLLWALEGAIQGVHWQTVVTKQRFELLMQLDDLEKGASPPT